MLTISVRGDRYDMALFTRLELLNFLRHLIAAAIQRGTNMDFKGGRTQDLPHGAEEFRVQIGGGQFITTFEEARGSEL
jgi:hypothetical protein